MQTTILQAADEMIDQLDLARLEYSFNFGQAARKKLEECVASWGFSVFHLPSTNRHQYLFEVSDVIVEVERTGMDYVTRLGDRLSREIIGVALYGIDLSDNECEPYELGDIIEFGVERIAMVKRELDKVEFDAQYVLPWMYQRDVLAA